MATPVPPHAVPAGPLAVRWLAHELPLQRAGAKSVGRVQLENAGSAAWRSRPGTGVHLSYHWLDPLGNPIVWAGAFILLPSTLAPGERAEVFVTLRAPIPPGRYRLAFDLVDEGRFWFADIGNTRLELDVDVAPRLAERTLTVEVRDGPPELAAATREALGAQEEPLVNGGAEVIAFLAAGCRPAPDWSRLVLHAHAEGYGAVGGAIELTGSPLARRRAARQLGPWTERLGRAPGWPHALVCPSLLRALADEVPPTEDVGGLPALDPARLDEPWLFDGRIRVAVPATAPRRAGRRPA
ncbi:MAG: hypothetical protein ABR583_06905 [Gaiellaceae bacterium]